MLGNRPTAMTVVPGLLLAACGEVPVPAGPDGAALYAEHCLVCHQADGGGVPFLQPGLAGSAKLNGPVPDLVAFLLTGSASLAPEERRFDNDMPGFDALSDAELAALLTHVRTHFGNSASPVIAAEVAAARGEG